MRFLLSFIALLTVLSLVGLFLIADFTSPKTPGGSLVGINLVYFFLSFFLSLAGIVTLVLYSVSSLRLKTERQRNIEAVHRPRAILKRSARQAIIFSAALTSIGLLRALGFANPLNIILVISAAVLIEVYFFSH